MNKEQKRVFLQIALFIITFITTTLAGSWWVSSKSIFYGEYGLDDFYTGMHFSVPFLLVLTVHEFGHYFTARYYKVKTTLPYFIPLPPLPLLIGTLGALIRQLAPSHSKKQSFDIGIAGPLAGFVAAVLVLFYGFTNLPPAEYIFSIHPEYKQYGLEYAKHVYQHNDSIVDVSIGKNLLFMGMEHLVADSARMPNVHEIMHYPYLFAGFLSLFFTFLNLIPIGQLDGGHVLYGLIGHKRHRIVASVVFVAFMFYAGLGNEYIYPIDTTNLNWFFSTGAYIIFLYLAFLALKLPRRDTIMYAIVVFGIQFLLANFFPNLKGFFGWLVFGFIVSRFVGIEHPICEIEEPLDNKRIILGWLALLIFVLCFSPAPIAMIAK